MMINKCLSNYVLSNLCNVYGKVNLILKRNYAAIPFMILTAKTSHSLAYKHFTRFY